MADYTGDYYATRRLLRRQLGRDVTPGEVVAKMQGEPVGEYTYSPIFGDIGPVTAKDVQKVMADLQRKRSSDYDPAVESLLARRHADLETLKLLKFNRESVQPEIPGPDIFHQAWFWVCVAAGSAVLLAWMVIALFAATM